MAVRQVLLLGDPRLYEVCEPVRQGETSELESVVSDLHETLMDCQQRIGARRAIAAPQIGVMKRLTRMTLTILAAAWLVGSAAQANEEAEKTAIAVAKEWLELIDQGEIGKSWETAAALFKGAVTDEQWRQKVAPVRDPLGKVISRKVTLAKYETSLPGAPDGEYVVIQFETEFENKAIAVETVTPMRDPDGEWRVGGYFIK